MAGVPHPHDRFFRQVFSRPEAARDLVRECLPQEVTGSLDLDSLEIAPGSFVDAAFRAHVSDLVCRVRLRSGAGAFVYVLLEHKSTPEPVVALQLLRYVTGLWEDHRRQGGGLPLPPVIPVVVYHGRRRWNASPEFSALFDHPVELEPFVPRFRYVLTDLSRLADEEVEGAPWVRVPLLLMLHVFDDDLVARLGVILRPLGNVTDAGIRWEVTVSCVYYILNARGDVPTRELGQMVRDVLPGDEGESIMETVADRLREEGRQQGMEQGLEQGLRQAVAEVLETRFGEIAEPLRARIEGIEDLAVLRTLHKAAVTTPSLDAFRGTFPEDLT